MKEDSSVTAKIGHFFQQNSQVPLCLGSLSFLCFNIEPLLGVGLGPRRSVVTCPTPAADGGMKSSSGLPVTDNTVLSAAGKFPAPILPPLHALCPVPSLPQSRHSFLRGLLTLGSNLKVYIC